MYTPLRLYAAALLFVGVFMASASANAQLSTYQFSQGTGTPYAFTSPTVVFQGDDECNGRNIDDASTTAQNIGFTFTFDGIQYTKFSVSTNGLIGLFRSWGTTSVTSCWTNLLTATGGGCSGSYGLTLDSIAQIAPLWDDQRVPSVCNDDGFNGSIRYQLFGSAPNRVLVIEWTDIEYDYYEYSYTTYQARLYETSNKIEFWYLGPDGNYFGDGASIGLAGVDGNSFMSVTPGETATVSTTVVNNDVDPLTIASNTLYTFAPCGITVTGNTGSGGTAAMNNGDTLFRGQTVKVGSARTFQPFTFGLPGSPCTSRGYTLEIRGPGASQYTVDQMTGTIAAGSTLTPTFTFTPTCPGTLPATLSVTTSDGVVRTYALGAIAGPQTTWTGNVAQGGTTNLASGDTLLGNVSIIRGTSTTRTPLTITNTNTDPAAPNAVVTFELIDPTGQYSISTTSASLAANQSVTPTITFNAINTSAQEAQLIVTNGCDRRTFLLRAFSAAPGGLLFGGGVALDSTSALFNAQPSCVGSETNILPITVTNTGTGDFFLSSVVFYRTDTLYQQGTGPFALLRDAQGNPIVSNDYMLMLQPGTAPLTAEQALALPFVVPQGQSRTIYAVFVGTEPGRRYARAFISSNGTNVNATDVNGNLVNGLFRFDLVARAVGAQLAGTADGRRIRPLVMPSTWVDDTSTATLRVINSGACDLLIRRDKLRIFSGDVNEFAILSVFPTIPVDAATNNYRFAPGDTGLITIRFTPSRSGTRMATLLMLTNDSTLMLPGIQERGAYYVDIHGFGRAGLDAKELVLSPVLVGGTVSGVATLENSSTAMVEVREMSIVGQDAAEFSQSTAQPWPAPPVRVLPGGRLELGVTLSPTGAAGMRRAIVRVVTSTNDTIDVPVRGEAGTTQLLVTPTSLFDNVEIQIGQYNRQTVAISNVGTFPVRLQTPRIVGPDSLNYLIGTLPRLDLAPGQTEYLEITFMPLTQGVSSATLEIPSNIGTQMVMLGGMSPSANGDDDNSGNVRDNDPSRGGTSGIAITGVTGGLRIDAARPNPATGAAELGFQIGAPADVTVTVHDAVGRLVAQLASGHYTAGRHTVRFDASQLPSGLYHVRVATNGTTSSTPLNVTK
jgi:hypothetical protein